MKPTIDESLKILKEAGLKAKKGVMVDRMKFWEEADAMIQGAKTVLRKENLAEYSHPFAEMSRFRRVRGNNVSEIDITLLTKTRRFKLDLYGYQYEGSKRFEKRILRSIDDFKDPTAFAYTIDQYLSVIESEL